MPHSASNSLQTMSRPSSTSTNSANAFPKPAGATLLVPEAVGEQAQLSPRSTFSFESAARSVQASERNIAFDDCRHNRPASRGAGADKKGNDTLRPYSSRQRAQYYEEQFAYKDDATSSARDRVTKDAPVIAELRTNVIIKDEYTLVTDLSHHLSTRYQRPESSIMITVNHSACLLLGGSFEPTYILTINALPIHLQPTTNKRNASLIQAFMFESIGVTAERGIIKFNAIQEDNLAINGNTILGEIDRLERQQAEENGVRRGMTKSSRKSAVSKAKSSIQLSRHNSKTPGGRITPPLPSPGPFDSGVAVNEKDEDALKASEQKINSKKSKQLLNIPAPPPIPEDAPTPKMGKRKSLMNIFRR